MSRRLGLLVIILALGTAYLCGCSKRNEAPSGPTIYISGSFNKQHSCYWKNGQLVTWTSIGSSSAAKIGVSGTDVITAGYDVVPNNQGSPALQMVATYWKNNIETNLTNATIFSNILGMWLDGSDIYLSGQSNGLAVYWKNGSLVVLDNQYGSVAGIAVSNGKVYAAGLSSAGTSYWIDGVAHDYPTAVNNVEFRALCVIDTSLYLAGSYMTQGNSVSQAAYWHAGVQTLLTDDSHIGYATGITVVGNDVYVAGVQTNQNAQFQLLTLMYWKNGTPFILTPTPTTGSYTTDIVVYNGDVYVAGTYSGNAVYWKNGVMYPLSDNSDVGGMFITH